MTHESSKLFSYASKEVEIEAAIRQHYDREWQRVKKAFDATCKENDKKYKESFDLVRHDKRALIDRALALDQRGREQTVRAAVLDQRARTLNVQEEVLDHRQHILEIREEALRQVESREHEHTPPLVVVMAAPAVEPQKAELPPRLPSPTPQAEVPLLSSPTPRRTSSDDPFAVTTSRITTTAVEHKVPRERVWRRRRHNRRRAPKKNYVSANLDAALVINTTRHSKRPAMFSETEYCQGNITKRPRRAAANRQRISSGSSASDDDVDGWEIKSISSIDFE
jgi:hypothetical protein